MGYKNPDDAKAYYHAYNKRAESKELKKKWLAVNNPTQQTINSILLLMGMGSEGLGLKMKKEE